MPRRTHSSKSNRHRDFHRQFVWMIPLPYYWFDDRQLELLHYKYIIPSIYEPKYNSGNESVEKAVINSKTNKLTFDTLLWNESRCNSSVIILYNNAVLDVCLQDQIRDNLCREKDKSWKKSRWLWHRRRTQVVQQLVKWSHHRTHWNIHETRHLMTTSRLDYQGISTRTRLIIMINHNSMSR